MIPEKRYQSHVSPQFRISVAQEAFCISTEWAARFDLLPQMEEAK